ncbi:MAG: TrkA family potassium uptake protein [Eubacteriales bacterium]|jgi:trk system potassium uptake protein TrkA|nr:TrkA family potassium uptake protein [Eubacteriales bacterium]MDD3536909.1 TrkA family potassium uptake protein [Eubacteriales bacterium]NLV69777.1 TrkA family potassium uptake protein [Clostridiales bacterium]HPF19240.1 TrkA family potassium uptake protein [Bacillota bacterium]HRV32865.1 TrkA family potassium uptake protein [Anaerovoracaceae bacterium]
MKSFVILGLGRFGISLARTLIELGHEVLGADADESVVKKHANELTHIVEADITSEDFLRSIEVEKFDAVVIAVSSNLQVSIMTTLIAKEVGAKYLIAKSQSDFHSRLLYKIGADVVILPEKDMGVKVAHNLVADNFLNMIEISPEYSIMNIYPPESWIGKTLEELNPSLHERVHTLALRKSDSSATLLPDPEIVVEEGDIITLMGENNTLKKLEGKR